MATAAVQVQVKLQKGNGKLGPHVFTYSKSPIISCPGSSEVCRDICYADTIYQRWPNVKNNWDHNYEAGEAVPSLTKLKPGALVRIHVSGDFDTAGYIHAWREKIERRPDLTVWVYTKSWRVPRLLPALERLRAISNVQMWASMDSSIEDLPPRGWRRVYIEGDARIRRRSSIICPEQAITDSDCAITCEQCQYCTRPSRNKKKDLVLLIHD